MGAQRWQVAHTHGITLLFIEQSEEHDRVDAGGRRSAYEYRMQLPVN